MMSLASAEAAGADDVAGVAGERAEGEDHFDVDTNFTPFSVKV